jgi:hypothetical protein
LKQEGGPEERCTLEIEILKEALEAARAFEQPMALRSSRNPRQNRRSGRVIFVIGTCDRGFIARSGGRQWRRLA